MKTVLAPIDFSDITPLVLATAASLAHTQNGRLVLLHVIHPPLIASAYGLPPGGATVEIGQEKNSARHTLARHAERLRARGLEVFTELREGCSIPSILNVAEEQAAVWIVIGSHGHSAHYDIPAGGTVQGVLREAQCPLLIIPPKFRNSRAREELEDFMLLDHGSKTDLNPPAVHGLFTNVKGGVDRASQKSGK